MNIMDTFKTKIIDIPNEKTVLIKGGYDKGINKGDEFKIIKKGPKVKDPETGDILGTYDQVKATLEVTEVYARFSELKKVKRSSTPILPSNILKTTVTTEKLGLTTDITNSITPPEYSPITIGDTAVKI